MKRVKNILPSKMEVEARVQGDPLGIANDLQALEALAEAARKRYEEDGSNDAKERYIKIIEAKRIAELQNKET